MEPREQDAAVIGRREQEPTRARRRSRHARIVVVSLLLLTGLVAGVTGASPASGSVCDDGRGWTSDVWSNGACVYDNICSPEDISLRVGDRVTWNWRFPAGCPMGAIDALGVVAEREVPISTDGSIAEGTVKRVEQHGVRSPARSGSGSVPATCGEVVLRFTVIAGSEVIATASGRATTQACAPTANPTDPAGPTVAGLLGPWDGSSGEVGTIARLYWAVFGRVPDVGGFDYWMARLNGGTSLGGVARIWTGLPEWQDTYAGTDDATFVARIYENVLGRQPEAGGFIYWVDRLESGLTRDRLVLLFSDSPEFRDRTNTA